MPLVLFCTLINKVNSFLAVERAIRGKLKGCLKNCLESQNIEDIIIDNKCVLSLSTRAEFCHYLAVRANLSAILSFSLLIAFKLSFGGIQSR